MENVLDLFSPAGQRMALQAKLKREFEEPSTLFSNQMFREDIYYMLILSDWSDEVVRRLIQIPNLLWTVAWTLREDDAFDAFFEQRAKEVIVELAEKS